MRSKTLHLEGSGVSSYDSEGVVDRQGWIAAKDSSIRTEKVTIDIDVV